MTMHVFGNSDSLESVVLNVPLNVSVSEGISHIHRQLIIYSKLLLGTFQKRIKSIRN